MQSNNNTQNSNKYLDYYLKEYYNINITNSYLLRQERKELFSKRILLKCVHRVCTTVRVIEYVNPPMHPLMYAVLVYRWQRNRQSQKFGQGDHSPFLPV